MSQQQINQIRELFPCQTDYCRSNVSALVREAVASLGLECTLSLYQQWKILSQKLNNKSKLTCLADRNHRLLLIKFAQYEAASQYKSSYFNRAKIHPQYIQCFQEIGPYNFSEVITIVNKLKLIKKYYNQEPNSLEGEDHIKLKIKEILASCNSKKRIENTNFHKFMKIIEFEDRQELINHLSKILRLAWSKEKLTQKKGESSIQDLKHSIQRKSQLCLNVATQKKGESSIQDLKHSIQRKSQLCLNVAMLQQANPQETASKGDFTLIDYFSRDYREENSFEADWI